MSKSIKDYISEREVAVAKNTLLQPPDEIVTKKVNEDVPKAQFSHGINIPEHFQPNDDYLFPRKTVGKK